MPTNKYKDPDEFAVLSATWILACNDEQSIMTYKSIKYRLRLSENYDIEGLIKQHGELFRLGLSQRRLESLKKRMNNSERSQPSWIRDIDSENERKKIIDQLTENDVFRSQFRTQEDAEKSELSIIDWGLQHIERMRKAKHDKSEMNVKSGQVKAAIILGIINFVVSIILQVKSIMS